LRKFSPDTLDLPNVEEEGTLTERLKKFLKREKAKTRMKVPKKMTKMEKQVSINTALH